MKNLHLITTDKPSRLFKNKESNLYSFRKFEDKPLNSNIQNQHIHITSDEKIKEGDWVIVNKKYIRKVDITFNKQDSDWNVLNTNKIIITTDTQLIKDNVQAIDDEFLEWFVKNPSCEEIGVEDVYKTFLKWDKRSVSNFRNKYKIIIPKEEPKQDALNHFLSTSSVIVKDPQKCDFNKQETLEEAAEKYNPRFNRLTKKEIFEAGVKWQQQNSYSEEEVLSILNDFIGENPINVDRWFNQFKKKL